MKILIYLVAFILVIVILRLGELYTQLARYQKYWNSSNLKPVNPEDFVYVALGDSAAQGIGASAPLKGYVGLIAEELQKDRKEKVKIINLSKSGAKVNDVLQTQLPLYEQFGLKNHHLITIEIGANDIISFDRNKFEKEMDELLAKLPKNTIIADIPSFGGGRYAKYENRVLEANEIINKLAGKYNVVPAKLYERVAANHGLRTFAADLFHPSDYGYRNNWLPAFMERLNER